MYWDPQQGTDIILNTKRMLDVVLNKRNIASENIGTTILSEILLNMNVINIIIVESDGTLDINKKLITIDDFLGHEDIVYLK